MPIDPVNLVRVAVGLCAFRVAMCAVRITALVGPVLVARRGRKRLPLV